jgi:hypothetical protein
MRPVGICKVGKIACFVIHSKDGTKQCVEKLAKKMKW